MSSFPTNHQPSTPDDSDDVDVQAPTTRRAMLRYRATGAAIGLAATATHASTASAADGDPLTLGTTNSHAATTNVNYSGPTVAASMNVQAGDQTAANDGILNGLFANAGTALLGVASGNGNQGIGIIGWSKKPLGTGLVGFTGPAGAYGGEFFGGRAAVLLRPGANPPITLTDSHQVGELYEDNSATLWLCTTAGTAGTWREIAGPTSAGAFHAIAPRRVYDSRTASGKLDAGIDRVLSVANSIDGTVEVVPTLATAVTLTVTITRPRGSGGYVAIRPQGSTFNNTSSINWFGPNQDIATTVASGLGGDRQISARGGPVNRTHLIVDVTGFHR